MHSINNQQNISGEESKGSILGKMDYFEYTYSGKIWRTCPTAGEGDCFFHSVFGTSDCDDGLYRDRRAKSRRMNWSAFLFHHSYGGPTGALFDVLNRCFTANDSYQHRRVDNPDDYTDYATAVADSGYWVLVEEIPILATLENVKIVLFRDSRAEPIVFEPNLELLGDLPFRNINEVREVAICLVNGHFSRLIQFEEPIATYLEDKSNSVEEAATIAEMCNRQAATQEEINQKELIHFQADVPVETDQIEYYSNPKKGYKKLGSAGIEGSLYQIDLLTLVLLNGMRKIKNWRLSTEDKAAAKLDDLIFEQLPSESAILLQAKHKKNESKKITYEDLMSVNSKSEFSLPKYFFSFQEAKSNFKVQNVVICTNLKLDEKTKSILKEESVSPDSVLHFEGAENICYGFSGCSVPELKQNINTYQAENLKYKEVAISDEHINDFLNHLKFFSNCLGDKNVENIIQQTISRVRFSENLPIKMIREDIRTKMTDWFKEESGRYLTEVEATALFCDMISNKYCEDLKLYDIRFKRNNLPLILHTQQKIEDKAKEKNGKKMRQQNKNDIPVKDPKRISHIIPDKEYMLNVVKIYHALPTHHKDKTLFVNPDEIFEIQRQIIGAFEVQHYTILVMVCPNAIEETIAKEMCNKAMKALNTHKYKHVILIAEEKNSLATQLKHANINHYEVITDSITFADLEETTQQEFKRKKLINFQGSTMSLEELFTPSTQDDLNQIVSSELLVKLARGDKSKVGQELPHPDNYYISRNFNRKGQNLSEEELLRLTEEKVILISDSAGMGKSCVLTSLAMYIKKDNPSLWVIRFDLNNYTNFMQMALTENRKSVSIIDLLNSQETSKIKNEFGRKLFTTSKRIVLMLDGVDEISPTYTELVINLIRNSLLQVNLRKMFITTRPHMFKDFTEITSRRFSKDHQEQIPEQKFFTLEPFSQLNQINFLIKYWTDNLNLRDDVRKSRCQIFAETLAKKISAWIREKKRNNFAGIPLQTRMLAEIFQEKDQTSDEEHKWERCKEFLSSDNEEPKLPSKIALTQLFEMFINKKCDIYIKKNNPTRLPATDDALKLQLMECQKYHGALALKQIFDSDKWDLFTCYTNVEWPIPSKIGDDVLFRVGVVQRQGENIEFLHRTFAEFFVADCLLIELKCKPIKKDFQQFFMSSILSRKQYCVIRAFLNSRMRNELHLIENSFRSYFLPHCISEGLLTKYFEVYNYEGCAGIFECLIKCIDKEQPEILSKARNKTRLMYGALHSAIRYGHLNILKLLLELNDKFNKGKDAHKQFLAFVVIYAVTSNLGTFQFLSRKIDESDESLGCSTSGQYEVAFMGRFGIVELWIEKAGTDRNVEDNICGSMAHYAAVSMSRLEAVKFVMEQIGADVNAKDSNGETVLHVSWGELEIVKYLVDEGAKINEKNNKGEAVLHKALRGGKLEIVKYLVEEARADINVEDNDGSTALHVATSNGKLEIMKYLVEEAKADIKVEDNDGFTALHSVAYWGNLEKIKYLVEEAEADVNVKNNVGWTALHVAAYCGNFKIIKYLVEEAAADINMRNKAGLTAIHAAARNGKLEIVKYLVEEAGVDINVKDNDGSAALHQAARNGKLEIVKYLVEEAGVDINAKNKAGWAAVHAAARSGKLAIFKYLVEEAGADINAKNKAGLMAVHAAACNGKLEIFKYLVDEAGADVNVKGNDGSTALHKAAYNGKLKIIKYLVEEAGADIDVKNKAGLAAVHEAARNGKLEIFKYLVEEAGMDINVKDINGSTALHEAAYNGKLEIIKYLVEEAGADINVKNKAGLTAVHAAARNGKLEIFKYLVEKAAKDTGR